MIHPIVAGLVTTLVIYQAVELAEDIYYGLTAWFEKREREKAERMVEQIMPDSIYVEVDAGHNREWTCTSTTNFDHEALEKIYHWQLIQAQQQLKRRAMEDELNRRKSNSK